MERHTTHWAASRLQDRTVAGSVVWECYKCQEVASNMQGVTNPASVVVAQCHSMQAGTCGGDHQLRSLQEPSCKAAAGWLTASSIRGALSLAPSSSFPYSSCLILMALLS